ncbi:MAG TPA: polymer-forming cytoskeletal protein, partial [Polyangiaceae bacterium]
MGLKTSKKRLEYRLWGVVAAAVLCGGGVACSDGAETAPNVAAVEQALDPNTKAPLQLSFALGETTALSDVVVAARDFVRLADRVDLGATTNVTHGRIEAGNDAKVGTLSANGEVRIGHRTRVTGNVQAGGAVVRESSAVVTGSINQNLGSRPPVTIGWTVQAPVNSQGPVSLEPDQTRDLAPARYGALSVKSRSTLTLHTGVYVFSSIMLEPQAELRIDDREGPVQIVVEGQFTFRGRVVSARQGIPQVLFAIQGNQDAFVESPFIGAIVAPNATVRFQAARPEGHRAIVIGKSVWLEPDTKIRRLPFDWGTVVGPTFDPIPPNTPIHTMPEGDKDLTVDIPSDGTSTTATTNTDTPVTFTLPPEYTIAGGIIGNGTVIFRFGSESCTYRGQSSTARPETPDELIKGTLLKLESCTDGLPAGTPRTGTQFELTVNPIPDYPVTVQPPLERPDLCADRMEILTPEQTRSMRQGFNWSSATKVAGDNPDGTPTLYYAWIHIRNKAEALSLKKLFIHVLNRPLFDEELMQFAGKCGAFTNPGDGEGMFVPAVIPGKTYNKLIDALTSGDVSGDRVIFDAVILRDVPAAARNPNGSINLRLLAESGFRYLDYEANPFAPDNEIVLEGGASKVLTDALAWVGQAARDVGEIVTGALNELDQLFRGEVEVEFWVHALTNDSMFRGDVMKRAWGTYAGQPIGATGMQVKILQKMFDTPIPSTAKGDTNINGHVVIDATDGADIRGTGLCVEMRTRAAIVTDFLIASEICDLRGYDALTSPTGAVSDFRLDTLNSDKKLQLHIDNTRLIGLYQSDDVFRYSEHVMGYTPKRARILSGYWATTFSRETDTGHERLFAPCLNFPNSLSDTLTAAAGGAGAGIGAIVGSVVPGIGTGVGAAVGAIALGTFAAVVGNSDIVMSTESKLRDSRGVMSHEYGHYMFCNMIYDADEDAVDHVI